MNVTALQIDIAWENKPANYAKVVSLLEEAAPERNTLVVLPEMFATGFSMDSQATAESYGGETEQFLARTARQFGVCLIGGAAMLGRDGRARNKALVFSPAGELISYYSKMHLFSPGGEDRHYRAGDRPAVFHWENWAISPFICYDLRFPESFRQAAAAHRPELFVVIANFPAKRIQHWLRLLPARAIENQAYVVGTNRIGSDPFNSYSGHSVIVDPQGEVIADAGESETWITARLDRAALNQYRERLPFLEDLAPIDRQLKTRPGV